MTLSQELQFAWHYLVPSGGLFGFCFSGVGLVHLITISNSSSPKYPLLITWWCFLGGTAWYSRKVLKRMEKKYPFLKLPKTKSHSENVSIQVQSLTKLSCMSLIYGFSASSFFFLIPFVLFHPNTIHFGRLILSFGKMN